MKNLFVPYEESWGLKELGFDEPCFGFWDGYNGGSHFFFKPRSKYHWLVRLFKEVPDITTYNQDYLEYTEGCNAVLAPIYQQAFKFLRDKYKLSCSIELTDNSRHYYFDFIIYDSKDRDWNDEDCFDSCKRLYSDGTYSTYEEAELECLKKLIGIVKTK